MLTIRIIAVGTIKETFWENAIAEYSKRLTKFCKLEIIQIRETNPRQESADILTQIRGHAIMFDPNGELVTSPDIATRIEKLSQNTSTLSFVIGGSGGVGDNLNNVTDRISFGRVTYPHQLFRVIALEQIYRAFTISNNIKYHK